jgi:hypothetical protein
MIAFGGVVVDDVQDHFQAGGMERAHHALELADRVDGVSGCRVADVGREERERVIAPVVRQPALDKMPVVRVMMNGHQLDGRDAEVQQVVDRGVGRQRLVGAADALGQPRLQHGEPADVHLVDDGLVPRRAGRAVVTPGERGIDNGRERRERRAVPGVQREVLVGVANRVREHRIVPPDWPADGFRIRIEQHFVRVEAHPVCGIPRTMDPEPVELTGTQIGHVAVPVHVRLLGQRDALALDGRIGPVEEAQIDAGGMLREHREVDAEPVPRCPEGVRLAGPDADGSVGGSGADASGSVHTQAYQWQETYQEG